MKPEEESTEVERAQLKSMDSAACGLVPLQFVKKEDYNTFTAEYAWDGDDLVFHFFRSPERAKEQSYWLTLFPKVLDPVARDFFSAESPRLRAAFTEELDSWWLRANNYGNIIDKTAFAELFLSKMDQALDTKSST